MTNKQRVLETFAHREPDRVLLWYGAAEGLTVDVPRLSGPSAGVGAGDGGGGRTEVRRVIDVMAPGGGFCLAPSHDLMLDEFPAGNVVAMYDEACAYGSYGEGV